MKILNEDEVKALMKTDAYTNKFNPEHQKTQNYVQRSFENLYPDDDRNIHPENYYIWETQNDDRVRESHFERHGMVFNWDNPPEGGHPGEDYNCRCTAQPYAPPKKNKFDRIQEINERLAEIEDSLANNNEERNHELLKLDRVDNEIIAVTGAIDIIIADGLVDGLIDAFDVKGERIVFDYDIKKLPTVLAKNTNELKIGANIAGNLYEYRELISRLENLTKEREEICQTITKINEKISVLEEEKQQLLRERTELESSI